jgi:hypothetical protein
LLYLAWVYGWWFRGRLRVFLHSSNRACQHIMWWGRIVRGRGYLMCCHGWLHWRWPNMPNMNIIIKLLLAWHLLYHSSWSWKASRGSWCPWRRTRSAVRCRQWCWRESSMSYYYYSIIIILPDELVSSRGWADCPACPWYSAPAHNVSTYHRQCRCCLEYYN